MTPSAKPINILEVNKFYFPHIGGIERIVQALVEGFASRGHRVRVLTCRSGRGPRRVRRCDGAVIVEASSLGTLLSMPISPDFLLLFLRLRRWAHVIHWHEPFPLATAASLFCPKAVLSIVTWHSDIVRQRLLGPFCRFLQRAALRRADLVVPSSDRLARFSAVVDEDSTKTRTIPFGLALERITRVDPSTEERWVRERRPFPRYALFVGRLVYYKGIDTLLAAFAQCNVSLVVLGHGPLERRITEDTRGLGSRERIRLIRRPVDDDELALFYKHCAFLVFPSVAVSETFGLVQIEAMAFGKPVVNTNLPTGVPTVSIDGVTGLTVEPNDSSALKAALERLWGDPDLCSRLGNAAHERAWSEFQHNTMVDRYLALVHAGLQSRL